MTGMGLRKAALYLAAQSTDERGRLLAALPTDTGRALKPLIAEIVANGWDDPDLVGRLLAEDLRGLAAQSALSVDALLALAQALPADWTARLLVANTAIDAKFMLALLDKPLAQRVQPQLERVTRLPDRLREALLIEAAGSVRSAA